MAFSIEFLSGSTNGRPIKVAQTADPGTTIHTAIAGTTQKDEVFLYAHNSSAAAVELTIEFGGNSSPDDLIKQTIAAKDGVALVIPGLPINNGLVVKAYAGTANVITISGYVQRGP